MNGEKIVKEIEEKVENRELKDTKELEECLMEYVYRGTFTRMKVNEELERLSKEYDNQVVKNGSSKRVTRTPQSRYF